MTPPHVTYGASLRSTLRATSAAYGYTLTTATTLAVLTDAHGIPGAGEVIAFALGGLLAFAVMEAIVHLIDPGDEHAAPRAFPFAGALNVVAVGVALGAADLVGHTLRAEGAWFVVPLLSTALYMALVAGQSLAVARLALRPRRRRPSRDPRTPPGPSAGG